MFVDIVFPKNNEKEFLKVAKTLGTKGLIFVYPYSKKVKDKKKDLDKINSGLNVYFGVLADHKTAHNAKFADLILIRSSEKNRFVLEKKKFDVLFGLELNKRKDFIHHRNSGLNQVLCKFAKKNNTAIGFSFSSMISSVPLRQKEILGRISQNIRFCRKFKVKTALASFANDPFLMRAGHDLKSLGVVLGMHPKEADNSLNFIYKRIQEN